MCSLYDRALSLEAIRALLQEYDGVINQASKMLVLEIVEDKKLPNIVMLPLYNDGQKAVMMGLSSHSRARLNELRKLV